MSAEPARLDRRAARRAATKAEIVAAAWRLVREHGLAGLSMRELGDEVGMKAQSLYSYFSSKDEIYDAMFHEGSLAFLTTIHDAVGAAEGTDDPRDDLRRGAHAFFAFSTADPVRHQLLFQRTLPGFEPSPESYAVAVAVIEEAASAFGRLGVTDPAALDLWTATLTGLTSQQIANDPGGSRWERLVDRAVDMLLAELAPIRREPTDPTR